MILHYSWQCLEDATSFDYYGVLVKGGVEGKVERGRATKEATKRNKLFHSLAPFTATGGFYFNHKNNVEYAWEN